LISKPEAERNSKTMDNQDELRRAPETRGLTEIDCEALGHAAAALPGSYAIEVFPDADGIWATIEPLNQAALELRFSFGRMPGCVVIAVRRHDGTRGVEFVDTIEAAIAVMNAKVFDYFEMSVGAQTPLRSRH
jgi:hypothetical protein